MQVAVETSLYPDLLRNLLLLLKLFGRTEAAGQVYGCLEGLE